MNYMLDTDVLIFLGRGYENRIGRKALQIYNNPESRLFVSQISFWEMEWVGHRILFTTRNTLERQIRNGLK